MEKNRERAKLINRAKRIHGQVESVERSLIENRECSDVLMLLAAVVELLIGVDAERKSLEAVAPPLSQADAPA